MREKHTLPYKSKHGMRLVISTKAFNIQGAMATFEDFQKLDIRVGKIVKVENFPEAKKPSYKIQVDLGPEIVIKKSCAQLPQNYKIEDLVDKQVLCVVNFPPRQIGPAISEVLTLGVPDDKRECILVVPDKNAPLGGHLY